MDDESAGIRPVHVAELNQSQKPALRAEDHPGDREVRDIVSIFAVTRRSARARTRERGNGEEGRSGGEEKNKAISERKHVKSIVNRLRLCPTGIL